MMSIFRKNNLPPKDNTIFLVKIHFFWVWLQFTRKTRKYTTQAHVSFHFLWNSKTLHLGIFNSYLVTLDIEIRVGSPRWRGILQLMVEVHHYGRDRYLDFGTKMLLYVTVFHYKKALGIDYHPLAHPLRSLGNPGKQTLRYDHVSPFPACGNGTLGTGHNMSRP